MNDDLISREALKKEFADRARAARNWKESALNSDNEESAIRADAILSFLTEVKLTIDNAPTITPDMALFLAYESGKASAEVDIKKQVWDLYKKHQSHLATNVYEFGIELKKLLDMEADNEKV